MLFKATEGSYAQFLSLPESGMGYQLIRAIPMGKTRENNYVVYNSQLIVELDLDFDGSKMQILEDGFEVKLNESEFLEFKDQSILPLTKSDLNIGFQLSEGSESYKGRRSGGSGAIENPTEICDGREIFVRLSHYKDDKRIDSILEKLRPGTYTTMLDDYDTCVKVNDDPIDRYALPSDELIKYAFYVKPDRIDHVQRGVVQPAFGRIGGGLEAFFKNGTSTKTYLERRSYGK